MVWEGTRGQNMTPNRLSHIYRSHNTVLFVNATIGFSENLFLVSIFLHSGVLKVIPPSLTFIKTKQKKVKF